MNQLFALVPDALADMRAIFARRWWIALIAMLASTLAVFALFRILSGDVRLAVSIAGFLGTLAEGVLWYFVYADAMRIGDPDYELTGSTVFSLVMLALGLGLLGALVSIPAAVLVYGLHIQLLWWPWLVVLIVTLTARLGFIYFAVDEPGGAFAYSWRVSGGRALVPSIILAILVCSAAAGFQVLGTLATGLIAPRLLGIALDPAATAFIGFATSAFFVPWTFRWLRIAETMQTIVPE